MASFNIEPLDRFAGASTSIRRPREFAHFSYDDSHGFLPLSEASLKYYYPPFIDSPRQLRPAIDLSQGFETFDQHDDSKDEHLDALLDTLVEHERKTGERVQADIVTWRGMITKIMTAPFDMFSEFEMNATYYQGTIFIEEHYAYKAADRASQQRNQRPNNHGQSQELMQYWGYKFEALSTLSAPWAATPRAVIESRPSATVTNKSQYCSIVNTGIGTTSLVLGGEVDCVLGSKPDHPSSPSTDVQKIPWIELKTSQTPTNQKDDVKFERKLLKFWAQSFLLGVPKIVVGFRSPAGWLESLQEFETQKIPSSVKKAGRGTWDGNCCINFAGKALEFVKETIAGGLKEGEEDGEVWRIQRRKGDPVIRVFRVEGVDRDAIVKTSFRSHREEMLAKEAATSSNNPADPEKRGKRVQY